MSRHAYRAALLHTPQPDAAIHHADGLLVVEDGYITASGPYADLAGRYADVETTTLPGRLITPGFVDAHVHFPQVDVMAAGAGQLLDWLTNHTFPAELAFADKAHADATAAFFLDQLLANGTTSALVFCSVHAASVDALFEAALSRNMRLAAGKVLMDRNAPDGLLDTPQSGRAETEMLIRRWRGRGRLTYAVTPRFALSCSDAQLQAAGEIVAANPDVLVHTHMSENPAEIAEVARLFPDARDYLDVYDRFGLLTDRSVFAHCVHADDDALKRMAAKGASAAFCPSSNMLLGSGLFSLKRACQCGVNVALGTDVGGGHSFLLPAMMGEAFKVGQLLGDGLDPLKAFYLATLGGAKAMKIDDRVGTLEPGKEADFLVIDLGATPLLERRTRAARTPADLLFTLSLLADDRAIERTYLAGALAHPRG